MIELLIRGELSFSLHCNVVDFLSIFLFCGRLCGNIFIDIESVRIQGGGGHWYLLRCNTSGVDLFQVKV